MKSIVLSLLGFDAFLYFLLFQTWCIMLGLSVTADFYILYLFVFPFSLQRWKPIYVCKRRDSQINKSYDATSNSKRPRSLGIQAFKGIVDKEYVYLYYNFFLLNFHFLLLWRKRSWLLELSVRSLLEDAWAVTFNWQCSSCCFSNCRVFTRIHSLYL